jgi:tetratricopeptide (TPR) repeat protein
MEPSDTAGDATGAIAFVSLPPGYSGSFGSFRLDPSIPLPLLMGPGERSMGPADLNRERLIGGALAVLSQGFVSGKPNPHAPYYREFLRAAYPAVENELSSAAIAKARNGEYAAAEEVFLALAGLQEGAAAPIVNLALLTAERGRASRRSGREEEADGFGAAAKTLFERAIGMEGASGEVFFHAARFFYEEQDYKRAKGLFDSALSLGLSGPMADEAKALSESLATQGLLDTLFKEAFDFIKLGKEAEGLERIERFLEKHPRLWNAWFLKGWALRRLERFQEGREAFSRALELSPEDEERTDILNELSICLDRTGHGAEAKRALERALSIEPDNVKIISNLGMLSMKAGDREEARGFFMAALELDPRDEVALRCLASLDD